MSELKVEQVFKRFNCLALTNAGNKGKPKRKNSEKRKEKSRFAARKRRGEESKIFEQIGDLLPFDKKIISQMDKSSIVRLGINYIKMRHLISPIKDCASNYFQGVDEKEILKEYSTITALNGIMLVLSKDGDMVYLSENIHKYLGLTDIDLIGQSIYEYSHPCDHNDIKDLLALKKPVPYLNNSSFIRMKCTLTNKGRNLNLKSAPYKVLHFTSHLISVDDVYTKTMIPSTSSRYCLAIVGEVIDHPYIIEKPLYESYFVSRHSLDMKYTHVDERVRGFLGYNQKELAGKSIYNFFHSLDLPQLECFFKTLFAKGQCESGYYRYLAKFGGHVWILTQATVITDSPTAEPQCVICINHVISRIENDGEITSEEQSSNNQKLITIANEVNIEVEEKQSQPPKPPTSIISSTQSVFAPKTADMESGFIVFGDSNDMTILSDAEDLTHLAPEAGDVSVPLDVPAMFELDLAELNFFEDLIFNNYNNTLLTEGEKPAKEGDDNMQFTRAVDVQEVVRFNDEMYKSSSDSDSDGSSSLKSVVQNFLKNTNSPKDINLTESTEYSPSPNDPFLSYTQEMLNRSPATDSSSDDLYSSSQSSTPPLNTPSPVLSQSSNYYCDSPSYDVSKISVTDNEFAPSIDDQNICTEEYSLANDELIYPFDSRIEDIDMDLQFNRPYNFETNAKSALSDDKLCLNTGQNCNYLAMLLQTDSPQKIKSVNMDNSLIKQNNSSAFNNKVHMKTTNMNHFDRNQLFAPINAFANSNQIIYSTNSTDKNKKLSATRDIIFHKNNSSNKRPFPEPPDLMYGYSGEGLARKGRPKVQNKSRVNKRIKAQSTESDCHLKEGSVLMNLLVNGEDITNGYSKCSFGDKVPQSPRIMLDNTSNYPKVCTPTRKCLKSVLHYER